MQLTLLTPLAPRGPVVHAAAPRRDGAPSRDAVAQSQLDRIASANGERHAGAGLGSAATWLALLGGLVVLGAASMWRSDAPAARAAQPLPDRPAALVAMTPAPAVVAPLVAIEAALPAQSLPAAPPAVVAPAEALPPSVVAAPAVAPDEAATRRARARQLEDGRRKAALLAQEQARADELQRQQQQQHREAERVLALADQARIAAELAAREAAARMAAAQTPRGVRETCAGAGGFIGEQLCRTRTCSRAEHQADPVCVQQREALAAQLRASADR